LYAGQSPVVWRTRCHFAGVREYLPKIAQEASTCHRALNQDAAPVQWVGLATHQIELGKTIRCTGDRWLGYIEIASHAPDSWSETRPFDGQTDWDLRGEQAQQWSGGERQPSVQLIRYTSHGRHALVPTVTNCRIRNESHS
jgi:hypothetical protein